MKRAAVILGASLWAGAALADGLALTPGDVACINYDPEKRACLSISTVEDMTDGVRKSYGRERVVAPGRTLILERWGMAQVTAQGACVLGDYKPSRVRPAEHIAAAALNSGYRRARERAVAEGLCRQFRQCGADWYVFQEMSGKTDSTPRSRLTVFRKGDPVIPYLRLRPRDLRSPERVSMPEQCDSLG